MKHNITASLSYHTRYSGLDVREIADIFGQTEREKQIHRSAQTAKDVLWDGDLMIIDLSGPAVKRVRTKTESAWGKNFSVSKEVERRSVFGVPTGSNVRGFIEAGQPGAALTALSAYVSKLHGSDVTPRLSVPYSGPTPENHLGKVVNILGVIGIHAQITNEKNLPRVDLGQDTLLTIGHLSVYGSSELSLPQAMVGHTRAIGRILNNPEVATEAVQAVYGGPQPVIEEVWSQAMAMPTARRAAEHVLHGLRP